MSNVQEEMPIQTKIHTRIIKQVAFAIGTQRERKLDELAFAYNQKFGTRIGRNDIVRFLLDAVTLDDLADVDLREYKK